MNARSSRGLWVAVGLLLLPAIIVPLLVGLYDRHDPELFGFPFYYWAQFAMIPIAAVLTAIAYQLSRRAERLDRERGTRGVRR